MAAKPAVAEVLNEAVGIDPGPEDSREKGGEDILEPFHLLRVNDDDLVAEEGQTDTYVGGQTRLANAALVARHRPDDLLRYRAVETYEVRSQLAFRGEF